jgi:hypothetical protein
MPSYTNEYTLVLCEPHEPTSLVCTLQQLLAKFVRNELRRKACKSVSLEQTFGSPL